NVEFPSRSESPERHEKAGATGFVAPAPAPLPSECVASRTLTRIVARVAVHDRATDRARRRLDRSRAALLRRLELAEHAAVDRIVDERVDAALLRRRALAVIDRAVAAEAIVTRDRVPLEHRRRVAVVLHAHVEHGHRERA